MGGGEPLHDVRRSDDSNRENTGDADDAGSQKTNERVQKPKRPERNWESTAEEELGRQRMRKAKAKKPPKVEKSQEAKKPKSQEAKKPRSQNRKKEEKKETKHETKMKKQLKTKKQLK